jgi:hypothetical protein
MRRRATSWAVVAVGGLLVVGASAWTSVGQTPTALPNAHGAGPQTVVGGGTLNGETMSRADESVGSEAPFQVLTFENYRLEDRERSMAGKSGEGATDAKDSRPSVVRLWGRRRTRRMELASHTAGCWGRNPEASDGGFTAAEAIRLPRPAAAP